jgi:hypothetical protein
MARVPKETSHLRVRIEPRLLARLERAREKSGRTLTGEIVERLEESFRRDDTLERSEAVASKAAWEAATRAVVEWARIQRAGGHSDVAESHSDVAENKLDQIIPPKKD